MDQELIAYLDKRFGKIDERFDHIDKRFEQVDKRFEQVDKRFEQVDKRFEQIDKRFEQVDERFEQGDKRTNGLEAAIRANGVQIEGLRGDIKQVAEGVAAGNEKLAAFRIEVYEKFDEMGKLFNTSHSDLHRRVSALEAPDSRRAGSALPR